MSLSCKCNAKSQKRPHAMYMQPFIPSFKHLPSSSFFKQSSFAPVE